MQLTPNKLKFGFNIYGPYLGAGVRVEHISEDWRNLRVRMKLHWFNRNAMGTHFGGSLYAMIDPHYMLMLMQILGKGYVIWDKAASIDFVRAEKQPVFADFHITDADIEMIKANTDAGEKYLHNFAVDIKTAAGDIVATADKVLYIRKKKQ